MKVSRETIIDWSKWNDNPTSSIIHKIAAIVTAKTDGKVSSKKDSKFKIKKIIEEFDNKTSEMSFIFQYEENNTIKEFKYNSIKNTTTNIANFRVNAADSFAEFINGRA
jgi:DNA-binding XRE family transcriptional regulator